MNDKLRWLALMSAVVPALAALPARARQVDVPITFDHEFIRQTLQTQLYTGPNDKAVLWDDGTGCGFLKLREPGVSGSGDRLRVTTRGEARVGTPVGDRCLAPVQWEGFIEVFEAPQLGADQRVLQFRVVDSNIYDTQWKKHLLTGKLWDLVKKYVQPHFEAVEIDLKPAVQDVRDLLPLVIAPGNSAGVESLLDSLHLAGATVTDTGVKVALAFTVGDLTPTAEPAASQTPEETVAPEALTPPIPAPTLAASEVPTPSPVETAAPSPEPTLNADELRRWDQAWQRWDAFVTFVVKQFGRDTSSQELRQAFADVLTEARFDIIEALTPSAPGAPDPTRALFLKTWERLAPAVRHSADSLPGAVGLRYLSFIAAGDALAALDQIGPQLGVEISADGLRRLARMVAPTSAEDPLAYDLAVDTELRQLFGFGPPLPPPDLSAQPAGDDGQAWWQRWFAARRADAAAEPPNSQALEGWLAPPADALPVYLRAVRAVLEEATDKTLESGGLESPHEDLYRHLVLATAWQESCWRQFVRQRGRITYMRSSIGSIGIMQINEHVWRGFYDTRGLRWDIKYNARAGAEILLRYLKDYAIARGQQAHITSSEFLARASYAVYNGGPAHLTRFLNKKVRKSLRRIDDLFWQKFQAVRTGSQTELVRCLVGGKSDQ